LPEFLKKLGYVKLPDNFTHAEITLNKALRNSAGRSLLQFEFRNKPDVQPREVKRKKQ
jgi:hypothetical protein